MYNVKSTEPCFLIKGRGMVFIIKSPIKVNICECDNLSNILGKNIIIDDKEYEITNIERRCYGLKNIEIDDELAIIIKNGWWNEYKY